MVSIPLLKLNNKPLPAGTSFLMKYGKDPIPTVKLYGNSKIQFVSTGGRQPPTALATYDSGSKKLEQVPSKDMAKVLQAVKNRAPADRLR